MIVIEFKVVCLGGIERECRWEPIGCQEKHRKEVAKRGWSMSTMAQIYDVKINGKPVGEEGRRICQLMVVGEESLG